MYAIMPFNYSRQLIFGQQVYLDFFLVQTTQILEQTVGLPCILKLHIDSIEDCDFRSCILTKEVLIIVNF